MIMESQHRRKKDGKRLEVVERELEGLRAELGEKANLAEERLSQIKYLQADFDNYRKSLEKQKAQLESSAGEGLAKDLLPLIDDLEAAERSAGGDAREGYALVLRKLLGILSKSGLRPIEAVGRKFDPHYHEAVLAEESGEAEGTILGELQKGYMFRSKVIRHSKVKVAKNSKKETNDK